MFNRNGSNNGSQKNGAVHVNGNGRKPDPAPASSAGQAIPAEHDLLWDGLSPAVTQALGEAIDPNIVSQRRGRGGKTFDYLEGHVVIEQANRIFGFGGWGHELVGDVTLRQVETVDPETGEVKTVSGYTAPVRVTVAGAPPRTDIGVHPVTEETFDGHDTAMKGAVTDGMKRAFRSFGCQFGNSFYGDQQPATATPKPERVPAQTRANGNSGQSQPRSRSDSQAQNLRKRLMELCVKQGFDEAQVQAAVQKETGKSIDDLTANELESLIEAAANKLNQMREAQAA